MSYKKYNYAEKESNSESHSHRHLTCHYCCKKCHTIIKCKFRRFLVPKGLFNGFPSATIFPLTLKDPIKIGYLSLLFDYCRLNVLAPRRECGFLIVVAQGICQVTFLYSLTSSQRRKDL